MKDSNARDEIDCSPSPSSYLDEYQKLVIQLHDTPAVLIDNVVSPTATVIQVDTTQKHGSLLHAVQILTDLNLSITKAYFSSDGRWSMQIFHVTDHLSRKLSDSSVLSLIEQSLAQPKSRKHKHQTLPTAFELTASDRPGILSEVFAVLSDLGCNVTDANVWTNNGRIAAILFISEPEVHCAGYIEDRLRHVLKGDGEATCARAHLVIANERRLHQMMFIDRDYSRGSLSAATKPCVTVHDWAERGYSVVCVSETDRPRLLFDVVCTLTDMGYVVFHGTIDLEGDLAHQEFYIRHLDGSPISSEAERNRVIQCLQAAIKRRSSEGLRLVLRATDQKGLLADITRTFRENGLLVKRAEVSTDGQTTSNVFYVTDASGHPIDPKTIDVVRKRSGAASLQVTVEQGTWTPYMKASEDASEFPAKKGSLRVGLPYLGNLVMKILVG